MVNPSTNGQLFAPQVHLAADTPRGACREPATLFFVRAPARESQWKALSSPKNRGSNFVQSFDQSGPPNRPKMGSRQDSRVSSTARVGEAVRVVGEAVRVGGEPQRPMTSRTPRRETTDPLEPSSQHHHHLINTSPECKHKFCTAPRVPQIKALSQLGVASDPPLTCLSTTCFAPSGSPSCIRAAYNAAA
jgi:hypothetical protein